MAEVKPFVGIDVSKAQLDVALGANEGTFSRGAQIASIIAHL